MRIILETPDILAVDKPTGINTHAAHDGDEGLVERLQRERDGERLGVHHRLDAGTSGVIVFSRTRTGAKQLADAFEGRSARKRYLAIARGHLPKGTQTLEHRLARRGDRRVAVSRGGEQAITRARTLKTLGPWSLLELQPVTGRTHQIRAQLAALGIPVVGDVLYGGGVGPGRMLLHATSLELAGYTLESPPPALLDPVQSSGPDALLAACIEHALEGFEAPPESDAFRLFSGPPSGVPGLRMDRFGDVAVLRCYDPSWELDVLRSAAQVVLQRSRVGGVLFKEHPESGKKKAMPRPDTLLAGVIDERQITVRELGVRYDVDLDEGLGCGLYMDQTENRGWVRELGASEVMNLFAYTCGFSVAAAVGGATRTTSVDLSRKSLAWGRRNFERNGLDPGSHRFFSDDAFEALARAKRRGERYGLIVIDPPAFARGPKGAFSVERDYDRLAQGAAEITEDGGWLLLCNNHAGVSMRAFEAAARKGIARAGRDIDEMEVLALDGAATPVEVRGTALKSLRIRLTGGR